MQYDAEMLAKLKAAAMPLMQFLSIDHHPHFVAIVDSETVKVLEGVATERKRPPYEERHCTEE